MTPEAFCYWLQGIFEFHDPKTLDENQVAMVRKHLDLVLTNVTKEPMTDGAGTALPKEAEARIRRALKDLDLSRPAVRLCGGERFC